MSFEKLLRPRSIAVIGASTSPEKVGHNILSNIIKGGFAGDIYPVHPTAAELLGKKCYPSVKNIPGAVECAVIVIKRDMVIATLKECAEKGVQAVITITAGFKETGEEGKKLQLEIARIVRQNNITMRHLGSGADRPRSNRQQRCHGVRSPGHAARASRSDHASGAGGAVVQNLHPVSACQTRLAPILPAAQ